MVWARKVKKNIDPVTVIWFCQLSVIGSVTDNHFVSVTEVLRDGIIFIERAIAVERTVPGPIPSQNGRRKRLTE